MENPNFIVPTPPAGDSSNRIADTEFVTNAIASSSFTGTLPVAATQTAMEAGVSTAAFSSPGRQQYHQSAAKAWVSFTYVTGTPTVSGTASYNISSLADNGTGDTTINFTQPFASTTYLGICSGNIATTTVGFLFGPFGATPTTASFRTLGTDAAFGHADNTWNFAVFFGDQP